MYDPLNRLTGLANRDVATGATIDSHEYVLGPNGNRVHDTNFNARRLVAYTYDDLYRLVEEFVRDDTLGNRRTQWTYDAVGNRLTQFVNTTASTTTYAYDAVGNRLTETDDTVAGITTTSYVYRKLP